MRRFQPLFSNLHRLNFGLCGDDAARARAVLCRRARLPRLQMQIAGRWLHPWLPIVATHGTVHALPRLRPLGSEHDSRDGYLCRFPLLVHRRPGTSISLRMANNVILMLLSMVAGLDPFASEGRDPVDALQGIALEGLCVVLACLIFQRTRSPRRGFTETQPL